MLGAVGSAAPRLLAIPSKAAGCPALAAPSRGGRASHPVLPSVSARQLPGHRRPLPRPGAVCPFVSWRGERLPALPPGVRGRPRRGAAAQSHLCRLRERRERPRCLGLGVSVRRRPHPGAQCPRPRGGRSRAWLQRFGLG